MRRCWDVLRKSSRLLREDGAIVLARRVERYLRRRAGGKQQVALPVALDDVLAADWTARAANAHDDGRRLDRPLRINWVLPPIGNGSGGHQNILRFIRLLEQRGHDCRLFVYDGRGIQTAAEARAIMRRHFPGVRAEVTTDLTALGECDAIVATAWQTAYPVYNTVSRARRFYFVQDYEPYFHAMGTEHVLAENSYRLGLYGITLGRWLAGKLSREYGMPCEHFDFGSDAGSYVFENDGGRRKIVFYARPSTPRRGFELGIFALTLFARSHPDIEIHMVGADLNSYDLPFDFVDRGVLTTDELRALYNESAAALVVSLTNMSLMPLELLAAGCIPVVNAADNNTEVSDNPFIAYTEPSPQALAQTLHDAVSRPDRLEHARRAAASVQALSWDDAAAKVELVLSRGLRPVEPAQRPTISAVVGAYNCERFIGETIDAILGQTRPPDEVIVVDDGSTDGTADVLRAYGDAIRVVSQPNGGCPNAFNRAFAEATGDYVAMCGADDVWEPHKLEWQASALEAHPEIDVAFGGAETFGRVTGPWPEPPGSGLLDRGAFTEALFEDNFVCASSILFRRSLAVEIGPFVERFTRADDHRWTDELGLGPVEPGQRFSADDYDYWFRALRAGAVFHYEPRRLVRYRRHDDNVTSDSLWVRRSMLHTREWHAALVADRSLVRAVRAEDLLRTGRLLIDAGRLGPGRRAFANALALRPAPRGAAWVAMTMLPQSGRDRVIPALASLKRSLAGAGSS